MRAVAFAATMFLVSSCIVRSGPGTAASGDSSTIPAEEQLVAKVEHVAGDLRGTSCDDFAARLSAWIDRESDAVDRLARTSREQPSLPAERLRVLEERLVAAFDSIMADKEGCQSHAQATAAFDRLAALVNRG